jgi:hypothetical protein
VRVNFLRANMECAANAKQSGSEFRRRRFCIGARKEGTHNLYWRFREKPKRRRGGLGPHFEALAAHSISGALQIGFDIEDDALAGDATFCLLKL